MIYAATNGFVDRITVERVGQFHSGLQDRLRSQSSDVLAAIRDGDWSDDTRIALDRAIRQYADDFGYDLDEEGQPLEEHEPRLAAEARTDGERPAAVVAR